MSFEYIKLNLEADDLGLLIAFREYVRGICDDYPGIALYGSRASIEMHYETFAGDINRFARELDRVFPGWGFCNIPNGETYTVRLDDCEPGLVVAFRDYVRDLERVCKMGYTHSTVSILLELEATPTAPAQAFRRHLDRMFPGCGFGGGVHANP